MHSGCDTAACSITWRAASAGTRICPRSLFERLLVDLRPGCIDQLAVQCHEAELGPEAEGGMWRHRVQATQQDGQAFAQHGGIGGAVTQHRVVQRVQHLHRARDHGVVLHALVVVADLTQQLVQRAPQVGTGAADAFEAAGGSTRARPGLDAEGPQPAQEAKRAFGARIGPGRALVGRAGEHGEDARRVGTGPPRRHRPASSPSTAWRLPSSAWTSTFWPSALAVAPTG